MSETQERQSSPHAGANGALSREDAAALLELSQDAIVVRDADGRILYWSTGAERTYGWTREEAIGRITHELLATIFPTSREEVLAAFARDGHWEGDLRHRTKDGRELFVSSRWAARPAADDGFVAVLESNRDITSLREALDAEHAARLRLEAQAAALAREQESAQRLAQQLEQTNDELQRALVETEDARDVARERQRAAEESERRFRLTADAAPVLIWSAGPDGGAEWFNRPWLEFTGRRLQQQLGEGWAACVHPDDRRRCLESRRQALSSRRPFTVEYRLQHHDGAWRWVFDSGVPRFAPNGDFAGFIGSAVDVTERHQAYDAVRASEARYRALVEASTLMVWRADPEGMIDDMPFWRALTGQSQEEVAGTGWMDAIHPEDRERVGEIWRRAFERREPYRVDYRLRHADGSYHWYRARGVPVIDRRGDVREWVGVFDDVDAERHGMDARHFLERASDVLGSARDVRTTLAAVARLAVDPSPATGTAFADAVAIDLPRGDHFDRVGVDSRDPEWRALMQRIEHEYPMPVDSPIGYPAVIRTGEPQLFATFDDEVIRRFARDQRHLTLLRSLQVYSTITVPLTARGQTLGALSLVLCGAERRRPFDERDLEVAMELARRAGIALDNAQRFEEAESARAEAEAAHARAEKERVRAEEASRAKSDFLATMSHEFRTPLNAILGYTQLLEMEIHGPIARPQHEQLERLRAAGRHLLGLVDDVLDLAKIDAGQMHVAGEASRVHETVKAALAIAEPAAVTQGVHVHDGSDCEPAVWYLGDTDRVRQILVNLLSNAIKFTERDGEVQISCGRSDDADPAARVVGGGPWTWIRVEDTGIGIAPEKQASVFEPFVQVEAGRTRTRGGTGLGLAISRRLARLMGGDLTLRSEVGRGSTFTLWLPAAASGAVASVSSGPNTTEADERRLARARPDAPGYQMHGLGEIGTRLREQLEQIIGTWETRLRADPALPHARHMSRAAVEDHTLAFLSDLVQSLVIVEQTGGLESDLLRDGSAIQRVIAERHGHQRQRAGWGEGELAREFELLRSEITQRVDVLPAAPDDKTLAVGVLTRFLAYARDASVRGWRQAGQAPRP